MKRRFKIMVATAAIFAVLVAAVTTTALATSKSDALAATTAPVVPTAADYQAWGCPLAGDNYAVVAELLGMTPEAINAELQQGKSLVEIAAAKGVTEDTLVNAFITPMKEFMAQQVTAGFWTQAQVDARLKLAEQHLRQLVNTKGLATNANGWGCGGVGMMGGWGTANGSAGYNGRGMMRGWGTPNGNTSFSGRGMMGGFTGGGMMGGWGRIY